MVKKKSHKKWMERNMRGKGKIIIIIIILVGKKNKEQVYEINKNK